MKYTVKPTTRFQKDLKRIQKRGYDISLFSRAMRKIAMLVWIFDECREGQIPRCLQRGI